MLIEINAIKRTMYGKPKKGVNKKALKCYSYSKLGHFARDYRLKNMVSRLQINMIKAIAKKDEVLRVLPHGLHVGHKVLRGRTPLSKGHL